MSCVSVKCNTHTPNTTTSRTGAELLPERWPLQSVRAEHLEESWPAGEVVEDGESEAEGGSGSQRKQKRGSGLELGEAGNYRCNPPV